MQTAAAVRASGVAATASAPAANPASPVVFDLQVPVANILDFGAVSGLSRDCTPAFRAAVDSLPTLDYGGGGATGPHILKSFEAGGGIVIVPPGLWLAKASVYYKSGLVFWGFGRGSHIVFLPDEECDLFTPDPNAATPLTYKWIDVRFHNLAVSADLRAVGGGPGAQVASTAFDLQDAFFTELKNVAVQNVKYGAKYGQFRTTYGGYYHKIDHCHFYNMGERAIKARSWAGVIHADTTDFTNDSGSTFYGTISSPDYLIETKADQIVLTACAIEAFGYPFVFRVEGEYSSVWLDNSRVEQAAGLFSLDHPWRKVGRTGFTGGFISTRLLYSFDDGSLTDSEWDWLSYPAATDSLAGVSDYGSPAIVPDWQNQDVRDGKTADFASYGVTLTYDSSVKFMNDGCLKAVSPGDGAYNYVSRTILSADLVHLTGRRLYAVVVLKFDDREKYAGTDVYSISPTVYMTTDLASGKYRYLSKRVEFGDGWELWAGDVLADSSRGNFVCKVNLRDNGVDTPTTYIAYFGLFEGGFPVFPLDGSRLNLSSAYNKSHLRIGGYLLAAFSGGPSADDLKVSKAGLDVLAGKL